MPALKKELEACYTLLSASVEFLTEQVRDYEENPPDVGSLIRLIKHWNSACHAYLKLSEGEEIGETVYSKMTDEQLRAILDA